MLQRYLPLVFIAALIVIAKIWGSTEWTQVACGHLVQSSRISDKLMGHHQHVLVFHFYLYSCSEIHDGVS